MFSVIGKFNNSEIFHPHKEDGICLRHLFSLEHHTLPIETSLRSVQRSSGMSRTTVADADYIEYPTNMFLEELVSKHSFGGFAHSMRLK